MFFRALLAILLLTCSIGRARAGKGPYYEVVRGPDLLQMVKSYGNAYQAKAPRIVKRLLKKWVSLPTTSRKKHPRIVDHLMAQVPQEGGLAKIDSNDVDYGFIKGTETSREITAGSLKLNQTMFKHEDDTEDWNANHLTIEKIPRVFLGLGEERELDIVSPTEKINVAWEADFMSKRRAVLSSKRGWPNKLRDKMVDLHNRIYAFARTEIDQAAIREITDVFVALITYAGATDDTVRRHASRLVDDALEQLEKGAVKLEPMPPVDETNAFRRDIEQSSTPIAKAHLAGGAVLEFFRDPYTSMARVRLVPPPTQPLRKEIDVEVHLSPHLKERSSKIRVRHFKGDRDFKVTSHGAVEDPKDLLY